MNEELRRSSAHVFVDDIEAPVLAEADEHHLSRVLRLRDGERVTVSDGSGAWRSCEWRGGGILVVGDVHHEPAPAKALRIALAPVKGDRTEWTVEKLVEIGIDRITVLAPVEHSVVRWDRDKAVANVERLGRIARAAASQSRCVRLPVVDGPVHLDEVLAEVGTVIAEPGGPGFGTGVTTVVIGPEGGFSAREVSAARGSVGLGGTVLRADTAAVVAATLLVAHSRR